MQHLKDCDKLGALAYPKPLPHMQDCNVCDYLNELHSTGSKLSCLSGFLFIVYQQLSFCYMFIIIIIIIPGTVFMVLSS